MAYYSSPSASAPPKLRKTSPEAYDVFLSFRGEDTRFSFTSHLHAALSRLRVRTYMDNEMERGDDISQAILKAIERAKVTVVVFSPNYASSTWCLDELVKIMECKRSRGQIVLPIFYHIDPIHVSNHRGPYADAFDVHDRHFVGSDKNRILRWKLAMSEAANISGWDCSQARTESEIVDKIATSVRQKLDSMNNERIESRIATGNSMDMEHLEGSQQKPTDLKLEKARLMEGFNGLQLRVNQNLAEQENRRRGLNILDSRHTPHYYHMESSFSDSSPAPAPSTEKHDVFLSFRGEETRNTFASHLHAALRRQKIKTYIDYSVQRGQEISPALVQAIEGAKVSVVIFSNNYAACKGCLDELAKIVECNLKHGQIIVPVFYQVSPFHVQNLTGSYGDAFAEHDRVFKHSMNKVQRWRVALAAAAKQNGWDCSPDREEAEVVEKITEDVVNKLDGVKKSLRTENLNDIEDLILKLEEWSQHKLEKVLCTNDANDWQELNTTNQRILQLKHEKFIRTCNLRDQEDLAATELHIAQIAEKQNRMRGLYRGPHINPFNSN